MITAETYRARRKMLSDALRSGEYTQGYNRLTSLKPQPNGDAVEADCCLGVACKVAIDNGLMVSVSQAQWYGEGTARISYGGEDFNLPASVQMWYGFAFPDGAIRDGTGETLTSLNDQAGYNFDQIADVIDNTPALFIPEAQ